MSNKTNRAKRNIHPNSRNGTNTSEAPVVDEITKHGPHPFFRVWIKSKDCNRNLVGKKDAIWFQKILPAVQQTCMTFPVIHSAKPSGISSSTGLRRRTCAVWLFCILATIPAVTVNLPGPECTLTWCAQFRWKEIVGD